jgi:hypothetical protein
MIHVHAKEELVTDDEKKKRKRRRILSIKKKFFFVSSRLSLQAAGNVTAAWPSLSKVAGIF